MTRIVSIVSTIAFAATITAVSAAELRPSQVLMQARAGWMKAMGENLAANKLVDVAKDAGELAKQTEKVAANLQGERKDLTLKVASLAKVAGDAAAKGDTAAVKAKLGEIKGTCATCHEKYRDKK